MREIMVTMTTDTVAPPRPDPLTAKDRCDRCGSQAYLKVWLASGSDLMFCAHHAREHGEKLKTVAVNVHDETAKLLPAPVAPDEEEDVDLYDEEDGLD